MSRFNAHVNTPLVSPWSNDREYMFTTPVVVGDPTLRLRQQQGDPARQVAPNKRSRTASWARTYGEVD
jgi:hypothetical protein